MVRLEVEAERSVKTAPAPATPPGKSGSSASIAAVSKRWPVVDFKGVCIAAVSWSIEDRMQRYHRLSESRNAVDHLPMWE